jgi:predicted RNA-binding protein with PUA domain
MYENKGVRMSKYFKPYSNYSARAITQLFTMVNAVRELRKVIDADESAATPMKNNLNLTPEQVEEMQDMEPKEKKLFLRGLK